MCVLVCVFMYVKERLRMLDRVIYCLGVFEGMKLREMEYFTTPNGRKHVNLAADHIFSNWRDPG